MKTRIVKICRSCRKTKVFDLNRERFKEWQNGTLIKIAFPEMTDDDREFLISGTCGPCFDDMFKE